MATNVKVNELADTVVEWLTEYDETVTDVAKQVVEDIADGVMTEIKSHVTWNDNKYSKSFDLKKTFENKRNLRKTWYVKSPHYRLTHLLEFGHLRRNGKPNTTAYPHVRYGNEYLYDNFERVMKERIEQCKI